ncbi:MAG TPA: hypothetical protein VJ725_20950 [Thermoanaerobaculia bacterium]|nr:hypothetical protein [Thermoanaerobaculia bacterium]
MILAAERWLVEPGRLRYYVFPVRYLWFAAVLASLAWGAWSLGGRIATRARVPVSPRASSDSQLAFLKLPQGAESVRQALAQIPENEAVVFVAPGEDPKLRQVLFTVSLLALPHPVGGLRCHEGAGEIAVPLDADRKISAVLFYRWEPGTAAAKRLAPELALLRIPPQGADRPWTSFCSSPPPPSS